MLVEYSPNKTKMLLLRAQVDQADREKNSEYNRGGVSTTMKSQMSSPLCYPNLKIFTLFLSLFIGVFGLSYGTIHVLAAQAQAEQTQAEYEIIQAKENFRLGVNAFNYGFYNRAIIALENSLALRPEHPDTIFWLGRSYYASGYVRLGLEQWKNLITQNQATMSIKSFYETLDYRYRKISQLSPTIKHSLLMTLKTNNQGISQARTFIGPTAARAAQDREDTYIVDYNGNKILIVDANGSTKSLLRGSPTQIYNRPFDILLRPKGQGFILSQVGTHSLLFCNERGIPIKEVGEKGNDLGQFLGPQHLADSTDGYFYVSDWGNRRIVKLDYDGNFIFAFGKANGRFPGLQGPTGMAIRDNKLYIADTLQQKIFLFDQEGHYLETFLDSELNAPEALLITREGELLIADGNEIKLYNFEQNHLSTIYATNEGRKYTDLNYDRNWNIIAVEFNKKEIDFITPIGNLYTDIFVQINRVISAGYPTIDVDVLLQDREGNPIVGLNDNNFKLIEGNNLQESELIYTDFDDQSIALAIILGSNISAYKETIQAMIRTINQQNRTDSFLLIRGGRTPRMLTDSVQEFSDKIDNYQEMKGSDSPEANFDTSLRFTLNSLVKFRQKKMIVFISGEAGKIAMDRYNISDIKNYLKLENASMYSLLSENNKIAAYLANNTDGQTYNNANIREFVNEVQRNRRKTTGRYTLRFTSAAYTDLARRYIPIEVLIQYIRRSGKGELGYFAPLSSIYER